MGVAYDGIMGLVVGDALGVPYEFRPRDSSGRRTCGDHVWLRGNKGYSR